VFSENVGRKYPEPFDPGVPQDLVYSGEIELTQTIDGVPVDAGKLVLSPTRTYAPVIKKVLDELRNDISGMVHCSGGAQTKVLHFVNDVHVIKDNMLPIPPLFKLIQAQSGTESSEMYKVFNMGHRMEIYTNNEAAERIIEIAKSFNIDAQIVGKVEASDKKKLTISSELGTFEYA
jgi:phosphoribosylformylglycinamidine cyclo-ligase